MKNDDEKEIDRLFKEGLTKPKDHTAYRKEDWEAMEGLLNEHHKGRGGIIRFLPLMLSAVAAIILLAVGLFYLRPEVAVKKQNNTAKIKRVTNGNKTNINNGDGTIGKPTQPVQDSAITIQQGASMAKNNVKNSIGNHDQMNITNISQKKALVHDAKMNRYAAGYNKKALVRKPVIKDEESTDQQMIAAIQDTLKPVSNIQQQTLLASTDDVTTATEPGDTVQNAAPVIVEKKKKKTSLDVAGSQHPLVLSIIAAPDVNGVGNAFNRTQVGTNVGLQLSFGITRRLTISTGAVYSKKPYMVGFQQYSTSYKFYTDPNSVSADCRVLDIPINISYQVYNKGLNQFSIGTGISSYFMLRENYHFNYANAYQGPADYNIANQNKHLFGVLNLNAIYERRVNSRFGLNVQPYMKIPLTDIGYGRVDLRSTGLAIGASWYLNTSTPKK